MDEGEKVWKLNDPWARRSIWETLVSASDCETGARGQQLTGLKFATLFNPHEEQPQRGHSHALSLSIASFEQNSLMLKDVDFDVKNYLKKWHEIGLDISGSL